MASSSMSQAVPWDDDTEGKKLEIRDSLESEGSGSWEISSPKDEHCGIWHSSPNKERHASFGDKGTTASTTCYGDLIQTSQFLGAGHSGMFTIDQKSTSEPCYVESRARDLHSNSTDPGSDFSFGLEVPDDLCPDQEIPPEVNWVHWRWPRYEYDTRLPGVKACFQYMVHEGVVLQQFTVTNTGDNHVTIGRLGFRSDLQIRDLDFVDGLYLFNFDTAGMFEVPGPLGHGYVHVNILNPSPITSEKEDDQQANSDPQPNQPPERTSLGVTSTLQDQPQTDESQEAQGISVASQPHAVACVITVYMDGKAIETREDNYPTSHELQGRNARSGSNTLQIVVAYKLLLLRQPKSDGRNFVISAEAANINHWLQEERNLFWREHDNTHLCAAGLSMISIEETDTDVTEAGQQDAASLTSEGFKGGQITDSPTGAPNVFLASQGQSDSKLQSPRNHLEYFAWRHLEHILSVCAVPLSTPGLIGEKPRAPSDAIALTCGDMSGHRVNTPASFFAFRFLVDVARRLKKCQTKTEYMTSLEERIKTTCGGHITWLQQLREAERHKAEKGNFLQTGCFSANYWVTGEVMPESSHSWLPPNAITDTALQILKVAEYMKLGPQGDAKDKAEQIINDVYLPWLVELDRLDIRKAFAWPHAGVEGINTFRLDDHFWIWKALKFLDDRAKKVQPSLRLRDDAAREKEAKRLKKHHPWLERLRLTGEKSMVEAAKKFAAIAKRLAPSNVQRGILQRFTTENDVSRRRMLAVTRSARETRFLFHARDTALFYGEDSHFFPPISFDQLWANTIETQPYHEDNQDVVWDNALRYALGIVMGTRGHTLNKDTAARLVQKCVSILIGAGDHDAFFPGELKEGGREPAIFYGEEYRDFFYHAGFEINHVLLSNARKIDEIFQEVDETQPGNSEQAKSSSPSSSTEEECRRLIQSTLAEMLGVSSQQRFDRVLQAIDTTPRVLNNARSLLMKKSLPFTNVIYASNVNSIEEEWLYNYPDFLSGSEIDNEDVESRLGRERSSSESAKTTIARAISKADPQISRGSKAIPTLKTILDSLRGRHLSFCVFDCKKQKGLGRRQKKQERDRRYLVSDNQGLLNLLKAPRTAELAKKRFIWLPYADSGTALACWTASPERESHAISLFFDRHARYEGNVWDDTSILLNEWQTELHFSFYVLVEKQDTCGDTELLVKADRPFPGRAGKLLQRASISFRFDGDFFDRYWTCHFIEHVPGEEDSDQDLPFPPGSEKELDSSDRSSNNNEQKKWWQRRVLEPYLLNRALDKIAHASCLFLDEVRKSLSLDHNGLSLTTLGSKRDVLSMKRWQQFEHALQSMEDDLTSTLSTVQKWNSREKDRGEENPRWTRNDEKKYRAAIKKLCNATRDKTDTLNIRRADIRRLKEALTASQTRLRDDLELHQNENVRYFTYATVIFLPLGFAASFYSMNGAPDHTTIVSLVVFAFAAFAVTVAVLLSSRIVFKVFTHDVEPKLSKAASSMDGMIRDVARNVQHIRGGGVVDFFLEFSARRVVCAVMALRGDKLSAQAALNVLAGVFLTPVLGLSWLVKALLVNIFDILEACRIDTWNWQPVFPSDAQTEPRPHTTQDQYLIDEILEIPQIMRPFKR